MIKRRVEELTAKTDDLIAKQGCAGESIAQLLKMFEFHANWNMFGVPKN
jgi:hypothetical protein